MPWNNRIIERKVVGNLTRVEYKWYAVHEVYYDERGTPDRITAEAIAPIGDTPEELKEELERFLLAFDKPMLDYDTLEEIEDDSNK